MGSMYYMVWREQKYFSAYKLIVRDSALDSGMKRNSTPCSICASHLSKLLGSNQDKENEEDENIHDHKVLSTRSVT